MVRLSWAARAGFVAAIDLSQGGTLGWGVELEIVGSLFMLVQGVPPVVVECPAHTRPTRHVETGSTQ